MAKSNIVYSDSKILTTNLVKNKGKELYSLLKQNEYGYIAKKKINGEIILLSPLILNYKTNFDDEIDTVLKWVDYIVFDLNKKKTNIKNISIDAAFTDNPDIISKIKTNQKSDIKKILKSSVLVNVLEQDCTKLGNLYVANMMIRNKISFSYPTKKYLFLKIYSKSNSL